MEKQIQELEGQTAVITGGASGIGRCIAVALAEKGANIISIDLGESTETLEEIKSRGGNAKGLIADLSEETQVDTAFKEIEEQFQQVDILVNNAGIYQLTRRPFWEIDVAEWDLVMAVNVRSVFLCSRAASRSMRNARSGRIINISSDVVSFGMPSLLHYVSSKAAVVGMTRSMARELGPFNVSVNAVAPGFVATESALQAISAEHIQQAIAGQCFNNPVKPEEIAAAVTYLCSRNASSTTGQTLSVNGGANMGGI